MKSQPLHRHPSALRSVRIRSRGIEDHPETQALQRNLDRAYAAVRERARAEWLHRHAEADPSDACVSVHIQCEQGVRCAGQR